MAGVEYRHREPTTVRLFQRPTREQMGLNPNPLRQQLIHALLRSQDLLGRQARAELQHEGVFRAPKTTYHLEVNFPRADGLVITPVDADVVEMEADRVRCVFLEMRPMVKQAHVVLDLRM